MQKVTLASVLSMPNAKCGLRTQMTKTPNAASTPNATKTALSRFLTNILRRVKLFSLELYCNGLQYTWWFRLQLSSVFRLIFVRYVLPKIVDRFCSKRSAEVDNWVTDEQIWNKWNSCQKLTIFKSFQINRFQLAFRNCICQNQQANGQSLNSNRILDFGKINNY